MTVEENPVASAYCGGCGAAIEHSARFCRSCGADQAQFAVAPPAAAATPAPSTMQAPIPPASAGPGRGSVLKSPWRTPAGHRRSVAWIYYALIAIGGLILSAHHPAFLLVTVITGLYSTYLFRGGRFVIWFW